MRENIIRTPLIKSNGGYNGYRMLTELNGVYTVGSPEIDDHGRLVGKGQVDVEWITYVVPPKGGLDRLQSFIQMSPSLQVDFHDIWQAGVDNIEALSIILQKHPEGMVSIPFDNLPAIQYIKQVEESIANGSYDYEWFCEADHPFIDEQGNWFSVFQETSIKDGLSRTTHVPHIGGVQKRFVVSGH